MPRYDGNTRHLTKGQKRRVARQNMQRWMARREVIFARLEGYNASIATNEHAERDTWERVKAATGWGILPLSQQPYSSLRPSAISPSED